MFDGTLATQGPWEALVTFQQMIILCDRHGVIDMTHESIARRTTIPLSIIKKGIKALEAPDPHSRRAEDDGRRIARLATHRDWGWTIVNHAHYRKLRNADERREYQEDYYLSKKETSNKPRVSVGDSTHSTPSTASTDSTNIRGSIQNSESSIQNSIKKDKSPVLKPKRATQWPEGFEFNDEKQYIARKIWDAAKVHLLSPKNEWDKFRDYHLAKGSKFLDWDRAWATWCRNALEFARPLNHMSKDQQRVARLKATTQKVLEGLEDD